VVYGVGSPYVETVIDSLRRLGWTIHGGVENVSADYRPVDLSPIVGADEIPPEWLSVPVVLPLVTPGHRWSLEREATARGFTSFATVVDPTAVVSPAAVIGEGSLLAATAFVGAQATLGRCVCVNVGSIVAHHSKVEDYVSMGPGGGHLRTRHHRARSLSRGRRGGQPERDDRGERGRRVRSRRSPRRA
jgi:hypothetical protein